jgi:SET domain-containing protein
MVIIKKSTIHGKGVFTTQFIPSGTLLECDILEVCGVELLDKYVFPYIGTRNCLHIGFGSFLNSSKTPNVKHIKIDIEEQMSYFETLLDINIGEELFLNYM